MATVTPHSAISNRAEADRRVRHPLDSLRGYIRMYVGLEGGAVGVLYLAAWFWLGLALDYGLFELFGFDWVQSLNATFPPVTAVLTRALGLAVLVAGLLALVGFNVLTRLFREFSDAALALVLERRFPRELGDRLITAVQLADPNLSRKYGYSQAMVDHTVRDAADRVERVPVREVFNWSRLYGLWGLAGLLTLGVWGLLGITYAVIAAASDGTPAHFFGRFNNVACIWLERNALLMNSYWPRQSYLEILRFQDSEEHPGEMRVGRDEQRPDLQVRAVEWVLADPAAPDGWRPLRWADLNDLVGDQLANVPLPARWPGWVVDLDDLDPRVPASVIPPEWNGKTVGQVRAAVDDPELRKVLAAADALEPVEQLLSWQGWTVDKIKLQLDKSREVSHPMRAEHKAARDQFDEVFFRLEELADSPSMGRRLRKLEVPELVHVYYRGKTTKSSSSHEPRSDNKYSIGLGELKESVLFTVRGNNYYTSPRYITLVPPPTLESLAMNKEEQAYIYYRLQGSQAPLKGRRQLFRNVPVSITGETSVIPVPVGSSVELVARADRPLREGVRLLPPAVRKVKGSTTPLVKVERGSGEEGDKVFSARFDNIEKAIEFEFLFNDLDHVKGRRHVIIEPVDDRGPQEVANVELTAVLRKPQFRVPGKGAQGGGPGDAFLVTPDALLPWKGTFRDDYGLTKMEWVHYTEEVDVMLFGPSRAGSPDKKEPSGLLLTGDPRTRRASLVVSGLQVVPGALAAAYAGWVDSVMILDLAQGSKKASVVEGSVPLELFKARLEERAGDEVPLNALAERLSGPPPKAPQYREHSLQQEEGFDFRKFLPALKARDAKDPQKHFRVRLFVSATDNNVETGPTTVLNKMPLNFLVVSENELLAQILIEEENLRERLEKAVEKLKNGRTFLDEQVTKLSAAVPMKELSLVGLRADEVRKLLMDASGLTREVSTDYNRILREMEVNRIDARQVANVDEKICKPLERILNNNPDPVRGNFAAAEGAATRLWEPVEEDVARIKKAQDLKRESEPELAQALEANRAGHLASAQQAREQMDLLLEQMKGVLEAMQGELVERELIALLVQLQNEQQQRAREFELWQRQESERLLNELLNPKK